MKTIAEAFGSSPSDMLFGMGFLIMSVGLVIWGCIDRFKHPEKYNCDVDKFNGWM